MPPVSGNGYIQDQDTGLVIPRTYQRQSLAIEQENDLTWQYIRGALTARGYNQGFFVSRDEDTLALKLPRKGSGLDDLINQALADGNVANVGVSPVVHPQIIALLQKQMQQASTASVNLTGRKTPIRATKDALLRFNDSPLGTTEALQQVVYNLRVYNRGCPIATVPITYSMDTWSEFGMEAKPIEGVNDLFYLDVDFGRLGTPVPFLPSVFDLETTGNPIYPYWYRTKRDGQYVWVLLHNRHIVQLTPGFTSRHGIGTSAVWTCLGFLCESVLIIDERVEKKLNALTEGLVGISGVTQDAKNIKNSIEENRAANVAKGNVVSKGYTILTSQKEPIQFAVLRFRESDGVDFEKRRQFEEDVIALAFNEPLSSVVTRGGVGFGAQANTVADVNADGGVNGILHMVGVTLGTIYKRVQIAISRPNARHQQLQLDRLNTFSEAVGRLPVGTLSTEEVRAIINRDILEIPEIKVDTAQVGATSDENTEDKGDEDATRDGDEDRPTVDDETEDLARRTAAFVRRFAAVPGSTLYREGDVIITSGDVDVAIGEESQEVQNFLLATIEDEEQE